MLNGKNLTVEERARCLEALRKVGEGFDLYHHWPRLEQGVESGLLTQPMVDAAVKRYHQVSEADAYRRQQEAGIIGWLPRAVVKGRAVIYR
jgi:hypothetical protein